MADVNLYKRMYEVSKAAFEDEMDRVDFYDRKAQIVFGVSGVILAFMVGRMESVTSLLRMDHWHAWLTFAFYVLATIALFVSLALAARAIRFFDYHTYPDSRLMLDAFSSEREIDLLASMAHHFAKTTAVNEINNRIRASRMNHSIQSLRVAILLVLLFMGSSVTSAFYMVPSSNPHSAKEIKMSNKSEPRADERLGTNTESPPKVIDLPPRDVKKGGEPSEESSLRK